VDAPRPAGESRHVSPRAAWIDWAVAHPLVRCSFEHAEPEAPLEDETSVERHRGIEIVRRSRGETHARYVIEDDLAARVGFAESNGDLEDAVFARARTLRKRFERGSEADTFVATCKGLETARWIVDCAFELAAATAPTPAASSRGGRRGPPRAHRTPPGRRRSS
jgi:hypothetical protein